MVSAGERAVWEQPSLGGQRERVTCQHDASLCWAGQLQPVSVVCLLCMLSSVC